MSTQPQAYAAPEESDEERAESLPYLLRRYAQDIERYGRPLDSGLPSVMHRAATCLELLLKDK